jgi:hypothetical protein
MPEEIVKEEASMEMVPEQEDPEAHEVILANAEPELPQPRLFNVIMSNYEESLSRMMNGLHELDDLDDPTEANYDVDEWFPRMEAMIEIESLSLSLKFRIKNKSLGVI